jgi:hypothetical protein
VKNLIIAVVVLVLAVAGWFGYRLWQAQSLAGKYKSSGEIASSSITKKGNTWTIQIETVIAEPADAVWKALRQPERSEKLLPETFKRSTLVSEAGNKKTLDLEVQLLFLPAMNMSAEMTFDDAARKAGIKTSKGMQDIDGIYEVAALGTDKTVFSFAGTAVDQISLPLPQSVVEGALRELFVVQVRTIKAAISGTEAKVASNDQQFAADAPKPCAGPPPPETTRQVTMTVAAANAAAPAGPAEFRNESPEGYERGYVIDGVPIRETYRIDTRCTTAVADTGKLTVQVQSILISPSGLEEWVRRVDWTGLATLPPEKATDTEQLLRAFPRRELPNGWQIVSATKPPPLASPLAHQVYEQGTF